MSFWEVTISLLGGFKTTCLLFAFTLVFSLPLGLIISFGSMSKFAPLRYLVKIIVWIVRGIPLMLQIFIVFYVPGFILGAPISSRFNAALIAFTINYACYFSEIYRGGIESISRSQYEAGHVLGMKKAQIFFKVVLLQVIKRISAPMSNEVITLVKDTALARVIMVTEILKVAENFAATRALIWPLFYTGVFYLLFVGVLTLLFGYLEKRLSYFRA
ncbi:MAG: amino acid ABC transporter permease [Lachnospiraceae bacterium]|nr:amino acid ABC transporter permease [Lachnospiraceae bacterium]